MIKNLLVPPTQGPSSSGVRLNQARTMLDRASAVLDQLDQRLRLGEETIPSAESTPDSDQAASVAEPVRDSGVMETDSVCENRPDNATPDESVTTARSATNPPVEEMEALYSEMDALNNMDPATLIPAPAPAPIMGAINGSLAGGLAQAASAAVASALSSLARGGPNADSTASPTASRPTANATSTITTNLTSESNVNQSSTTSTTSSSSSSSSSSTSSSSGGPLRGFPQGSVRTLTVRITNPRPSAAEGTRQSSSTSASSVTGTGSNAAAHTGTTAETDNGRSGSEGRDRLSPGGTGAATSSTSDGASNDGGLGNVRLEHPRCAVMVEVLDQYNQIQRRLEPYMARYHQAMANDPVYSDEDTASLQQEQWLLWRVSEVLHFVSHAMHAISDIMVDLRRSPPRQLRARPIIIQQPALVQAQINVTTSSDPARVSVTGRSGGRPSTASPPASTTSSTPTTASANTTTASTSSSVSSSARFFTIPGPGGTSITLPVSSASSSATPSTASTSSSSNTSSTSNVSQAAAAQARSLASLLNLGSMQGFPMDGGDLVLMEVGPHGITIDSVSAEGSGAGGSAPPPELIQNIVSSITNQLGVRLGGNPLSTSTSSPSSTNNSSSASTVSSASGPGVQSTGPGRNSQAAGNSGTSTTNVTQTRVTHRPHVHVTPLNVPGMGMNQFDPFLPCQSHHIRPATRRRHQAQPQ
ncbi:hypothetical protein OTU49_015541, partial [Cherax quadricarinatus]